MRRSVDSVRLSACHRVVWWALVGWLTGLSNLLLAQAHGPDVYQARVVTTTGQHVRGVLQDVDSYGVYLTKTTRNQFAPDTYIPIDQIRKVVVVRKQKKSLQVVGAAIGAVALGFVSYEALKKNPPRSDISYGLTLTFSAAAGAAIGYAVGSGANALFDQVNRRVFRPAYPGDSTTLVQQLQPFCERYRQELFDRKPTTN
ncbi:hypothetical protein ACAW74_14880 [Fibrella sp. WM1]|uniref:hypothetical protein n=1 Tax=Fibrella musci TaxID=3242485 RepID=UPI0035215294